MPEQLTVRTEAIIGGETYRSETAYSEDGMDRRTGVAVGPASTVEVDLALDVSELTAFVIYSDQDVTFKTNDSGSPDDTLSVTGGKAYIWPAFPGHSNPLTVDVTAAFIQNAGGSAATVDMRFLKDGTP